MRLAAKLVLLFLVGMLLIVTLFSYLTIQMDREQALWEHQRHAAELADVVQQSIARSNGAGETPQLHEQLGWQTLRVRESVVRVVAVNAANEHHRPTVPAEMIIATKEVITIPMPDESGHNRFITYLPYAGDSTNASDAMRLEVSSPDRDSGNRLRRSLMSSLIALLGVATISGLVIMVGGIKMVARPLNELIDKVHRVGQGDFSQPVQLHSKDELGRLGGAINEMCEQLEAQRNDLEAESASRIEAVEQLRHAERLNIVGRMAAGIAHEIGTPLNVVSGRAELIASGVLSGEAIQESARTIHSESQRITAIVRHLLDFARQRTPQRSRQNLSQLIDATTRLMDPLAAKHGTRLQLHLPKQTAMAEIDPAQIQQVLTNLIVNAIHSIGEDGRVTVTLTRLTEAPPEKNPADAQPCYCIAVADTGRGIAEQDLEHIFEPFFTTKDVGEGTGLGLSISHGIVLEHHGWITVESEISRGSTFRVYLPAPTVTENSELQEQASN